MHRIDLFCLAAAFLVPNSQAVISNNLDADMNTAGYYCSNIKNEVRSINIHYGDGLQGLPCQVNLTTSPNRVIELLEANRNPNACDHKAKLMATRLEDRGWHCQTSGIDVDVDVDVDVL